VQSARTAPFDGDDAWCIFWSRPASLAPDLGVARLFRSQLYAHLLLSLATVDVERRLRDPVHLRVLTKHPIWGRAKEAKGY
jgi:hypothetical protein